MIQLDANGQVPRRDVRCRAYHVAGYDSSGEAWSGVQFFSASGYPTDADIEAYETFCGWASPEVTGALRSSQPSEAEYLAERLQLRFALVEHDGRPHLAMWCSEQDRSQVEFADNENFIAWVTDTMDPLMPSRTPPQPNLSQELAAMAAQQTPLSEKQRQLLRSLSKKLADQQ